jgi:hypothetical protein
MLLVIPEPLVRSLALLNASVLSPGHVILSVCLVVLIILSRYIEEFRTMIGVRRTPSSGK